MATERNEDFWEPFDASTETEAAGNLSSYGEFYSIVGEIIRPRFDTLEGAVSAANWGEQGSQIREDYLKAARLARELGDWDNTAHFSTRNARIAEINALLATMDEISKLEDGEKIETGDLDGDSLSIVASLMTYDGSEREERLEKQRTSLIQEIRTLEEEIAYARSIGCFEDYSHVTDIFEPGNKYSVGKKQQLVNFWHRELLGLCRVTEDGTKNTHEEAALARLIAYSSRQDMESQRRVQPRRRGGPSRGGGESDPGDDY